jgi:hypothetical protein
MMENMPARRAQIIIYDQATAYQATMFPRPTLPDTTVRPEPANFWTELLLKKHNYAATLWTVVDRLHERGHTNEMDAVD